MLQDMLNNNISGFAQFNCYFVETRKSVVTITMAKLAITLLVCRLIAVVYFIYVL